MTAIAPMVAPAGVVPAGALAPDERLALRRIVATAHVFDAGGATWLLAPAPFEPLHASPLIQPAARA